MHTLFQDEENILPGAGIERRTVLVPVPAGTGKYDYALPEGMFCADGDYVRVPLGKREVSGVIWGTAQGGVKAEKLRSVLARSDLPAMPEAHRVFLEKAARYTLSPPGAMLKLSLSVPSALEEQKAAVGYILTPSLRMGEGGFSPQQQAVLDVLVDGRPRRASELAREAGCGAGVVKTLANKGLLQTVEMAEPAPCAAPDFERKGPELSAGQKTAADALAGHVRDKAFAVALLDGVTGAGKTEVYFEAVAAALGTGKQVLILLPEIALTAAFLDRFQKRFGTAPALWHSSLSAGRRAAVWRGVARGETKVVAGARSALFLPFADPGLIVVDEEHDPAYKQEDGVIYNARDMAVLRAHAGGFPVVLVSATPSLETMRNVWDGRYEHLVLPDRHGGACLPDVHLIDLRRDKPERGNFISPVLEKAVKRSLEAGEQALLFLNRRGYAPLTLCRTCGHRFECPRCSAWLVEHGRTGGRTNRLHCHHCDHFVPMPETCPSCGDTDSLAACGPGVERVAEEAQGLFPDARICVLSSDTTGAHADLMQALEDIRERRVDIVIGTQMIAKGHHFPGLTCVGVVDADLGLDGGELRAAERAYQLLHQVAGRAGRAAAKGHVYVQTFNPDNPVMRALASGERDAFLEAEADAREDAGMPPFTRLAGIIVSGRDEAQVRDVAAALGRCAPQAEGLQTLGPAEAQLYRLRGKFRRRLLVRADKGLDLQKAVAHWLAGIKLPSTVRVQVDIDPYSFL